MIRWFHKHLALSIIAGLILVGLGLGALLLPGQLSSWREKQLLSAARASFERGDLPNAVIICRQLLQGNAFSPDACRLMVTINEQANSPQAIGWALKLADFSHDDPEALTKLATLGLKFGETGVAEDALNRLPAPVKGTAETISIQAILAITAGQFEKAESLFERATRLQPANLNWKLDLLKCRLQFPALAHADSARQELEALSKNPIVKTDALRALLQDARTQSNSQRALAIAKELATVPDALLPDRLAFLEQLQVTSRERLSVELGELRRAIGSSGNSELISQVMTWQNNHGLSRESLNWAEQLPGGIVERVPIQIAQCDALMGLGEWLKLRTNVAAADWGWMNYRRLAIYARAKQALGDSDFRQSWDSAITATAGDWSALISLANLAQGWGWHQQVVETLWLIARQPQGQRAALQKLYTIYEGERNLTELYKVAKRYWEVYPKDPIAMNNVASLGLLLGKDADQASKLAEEVYSEEPTVNAFAATYVFSLMRAHQEQEALKVLEKLPAVAMADPSIGLCYGLALAATGQKDAFFRSNRHRLTTRSRGREILLRLPFCECAI
jgi:Flp pilus assembly protein TadD